ncbi:major facilitator superfamily domain-containing protein [Mycena epipterygia]|nr:major facilitator superfamily domain-containing protein [Mycena epipterygia]
MSELSTMDSVPAMPAQVMVLGAQLQDNAILREKSSLEKMAGDAAEAAEELEWTYPDGGLRAWLVVLSCFIMSSTCIGWGMVWGVFQDYYHTSRFSGTSLSTLSLVGGLFSFGLNGAAYFFGGVGERHGYKRMIALSCLLGYCCLLASAFATKLYQVFLFQGCLLGLSFGISMPLYMALPSRWFLHQRGLATGIAVAGSGVGGGTTSPYYFITTYVKSQVPSLNPKSLLVVVPLTVMSISGGIGRIIAGRMTDRFGPVNMFFATFFLGGLSQMLIWTFTHTYAAVIVFSVIYGLVGCWFLGLLPVLCAQLFGLNDLATITGFMVLANSPGQLAGASIGGAVFSGSGGDWTAVSLYAGSVMLFGSFFVLYARFSHDKRVWKV